MARRSRLSHDGATVCRMICVKIFGTIVVVAAALAALSLALLWGPEWMVNQYSGGTLSRLEYTKAVDDYRKTLAQILGGLALLTGLYFTWRTTKSTEDEESLIASARLLSNLERAERKGRSNLNLDSEEFMPSNGSPEIPVVTVGRLLKFCALYVRVNAPRKYMEADPDTGDPVGPEIVRIRPDAEIEAILRILSAIYDGLEGKRQFVLDLNTTELYEADLSNLKLNRADLSESYLERTFQERSAEVLFSRQPISIEQRSPRLILRERIFIEPNCTSQIFMAQT